jgi:hypothetical protein
MNLVTTLVNTLEGLLKTDNLSNKADQVRIFEAPRRCSVVSASFNPALHRSGPSISAASTPPGQLGTHVLPPALNCAAGTV